MGIAKRWAMGLLLLVAVTGCREGVQAASSAIVTHEVRVSHPGDASLKETLQSLVQVLGEVPGSDEFYLDVDSVFCGEGVCRIDRVRIFWDDLGAYQRFELAPGVELEKTRGRHFSSADYDQLQLILSDENSVLRDVAMTDIYERDQLDGVDAVTSATPVLYQGATVKGAVWTCFTLWHWANGEIGPLIHQLTVESTDLSAVQFLLENGDPAHQRFALQQLIARNAYDPISLASVLRHFSAFGTEQTTLALRYLEAAPANIYYAKIGTLVHEGTGPQRVWVLNSLLNTPYESPARFPLQIIQEVSSRGSYQEIDLLLTLIEQRYVANVHVVAELFPLLDHSDFLIARRGYWFLRDQSLSTSQLARIEAFHRQHADSL